MPAESRRDRLEAVVGEVMEPVRRYLARRTDAATADDVLGEVLLVCWRRIDEVPTTPLPWAYGVARRCLANAERSARRQRRVGARVAALDPPRPEPDPAPGSDGERAEEAVRRVRAALGRLSSEDADLIRLWAWEELTPAQIAVVLDITANAAGVRLHRAKARLRTELGPAVGPGGKDGGPPGHEGTRRGSRG